MSGDTAPDADQCPTSCDDVRTRMEQVQRENDRLINELVRVRSEVATLRAVGNALACEVEAGWPTGSLARDVQAWRSAAGGAA